MTKEWGQQLPFALMFVNAEAGPVIFRSWVGGSICPDGEKGQMSQQARAPLYHKETLKA